MQSRGYPDYSRLPNRLVNKEFVEIPSFVSEADLTLDEDTTRSTLSEFSTKRARMRSSRLLEGLPPRAEFYFVHSYHLKSEAPTDVLNETEYEYCFPSADRTLSPKCWHQ
jgi:hypothetical protein